MATAFGADAQRQLRGSDQAWASSSARSAREAGERLAREVRATAAALRAAATRAVDVRLGLAGGRAHAFGQLARLARGPEERGIVLFRGDSAVAWAGPIRVLPARSSRDTVDMIGVAASQFYLALYATARQGDKRAVATALVHAAPPADRLARAMSSRLVRDAGIEFAFAPAADSTRFPDAVVLAAPDGGPLFVARAITPERGEARQRLLEQARVRVGVALFVALLTFVVAAWRASRSLAWRLGALAVAAGCTALAPLNEYSNLSRLFDPTLYYTRLGGPLTANAGALAITSALLLLGLLAVFRRHGRRPGRRSAALIVLLVAGLGPFLLRDLARGIHMPAYGASGALWLIWQIPLFLAAVSVLLAGATAGGVVLGRSRGLPPFVAPTLAVAAACIGPMVWRAPAGWPWWYTLLWVAAIAALALSRQSRAVVLIAATVAALGATALVWASTARGRVVLARRDLAGLSEADPTLGDYLGRFARALGDEAVATTRQGLLQQFVTSDLAAAGYPVQLSGWEADTAPSAVLQTGAFEVPGDAVAALVRDALRERRPVARRIGAWPAVEQAVAVPSANGGVTAVVAAPRTRLISGDPYSRLLGFDPGPFADPPYVLQLAAHAPEGTLARLPREHWRREGNELHGDYPVRTGTGIARAHVEIELRSNLALFQRGTLIVLLNLAIVGALWLLNVAADGGIARWVRARQRTWRRSYRARLTLALFAFFVIPASAFAVWSYRQLLADARQTRMLLVHETLRAVAPPEDEAAWIAVESGRLDTPLLLYRDGRLEAAGDPLHETLAPVGRFLRPDVELRMTVADELTDSKEERVGPESMLFGYRALEGDDRTVLAAPARPGDVAVDRRRRDLGILVLFTTAVGALAALWLSGVAARQLAQPVGTLRGAALSIAAGEREPPLAGEPTVEFQPVFAAFRRMASDLNASRSALEAAQRRLAAVLRNVASGVIAIDREGRVVLANPRADVILGAALPPATRLADVDRAGLAEIVKAFVASDREEENFDLQLRGRQLRGRITRLGDGAVVTLDDVSDLARAQRVLAWGEMARQVAHEIKNPLTPIRLGVQHLRRARADSRVDFDKVLDQNVERILSEIDRLDEIARTFSRYGTVPEERPPAEPTDVAAVVRDVVGLETMGEGEVRWTLAGAEEPHLALARGDELREVLLNVLENARLANARSVAVTLSRASADGAPESDGRIAISVRDDGHGIPPDVLPRIFEPHFSTRTSGSGLGLAVSRRLIESWGGDIGVVSAPGSGTEVTIVLRSADDAA
jgi:signal transduction histidine kinase